MGGKIEPPIINRSGKCFIFSAKIATPKNAVFGSLRRFAASRISTRHITWSKAFFAPSNKQSAGY
jgi:hypothetical protein